MSATSHDARWMTAAQKSEISEGARTGFKQRSFKEVWAEYMHKPTKLQRVFAWCMIVLVLVESSFLFIQAGRCFATKSAGDIDLVAFIILLVASILWTLYGVFVLHDLPLVLSAVLYTLGSSLVIVAYSLYHGQ